MKFTWSDVESAASSIIDEMLVDEWKPDYVAGVVPDGIVPAMLISDRLRIPVYTIERDEIVAWMPEDAIGYNCPKKKILVVVGDTGDGDVKRVKDDWEISGTSEICNAWGNNVRFAAISGLIEDVNDIHYMHYLNEYKMLLRFPWQSQ